MERELLLSEVTLAAATRDSMRNVPANAASCMA
jgi:hypothetical protein